MSPLDLQTFNAITPETLAPLADHLASLASLSPVAASIGGLIGRAYGLPGSPAENWAYLAAGVILPWATGKLAWAWETVGEIRELVGEIRAGVKLAAVMAVRIYAEVKGGRGSGGWVAQQGQAGQGRAGVHSGRMQSAARPAWAKRGGRKGGMGGARRAG